MKLLVLVLNAFMVVLAQKTPVKEEAAATTSVVLRELPPPWVKEEPVRAKLPRSWLLKEVPRPLGEEKLPRAWPVSEPPRPSAQEELPRPWLIEERPKVKEEPPRVWPPRKLLRPLMERELPHPWFLREQLPQRYYPFQHHPYRHYRARPGEGTGVALHPDGATSYVIPQVHGVGKRSAKLRPEANSNFKYPYYLDSIYGPFFGHRYYNPSQSTFVYHHQLHKRSTKSPYVGVFPSRQPFGSYVGYSYGW